MPAFYARRALSQTTNSHIRLTINCMVVIVLMILESNGILTDHVMPHLFDCFNREKISAISLKQFLRKEAPRFFY